jgi:tRNA pseudouridine38-40 synthase
VPRFLLTLQYRGTRYAGWQTQTNATGIQQVIEAALSDVNRRPTKIEASGRTDAGVHAYAQRAHVDIDSVIPPRGLILALNDRLPDDIRVMAAIIVADDFHARFSARRKTYRYRIWNDTTRDVFHAETHAWVPGPLDMNAMSEAIKALVGEHDFQTFTVSDPEVSSTVRTIEAVSIGRRGKVVTFEVTANGFLRYMMRRIAGLLIEIGRGRLPPDSVALALEPTFAEARWTAPANGLVLYDVTYADERR